MLSNQAVGFIETSSIAKGFEASDAMVKAAEVRLAKASVIARGKFVIMVTGSVGDVESALREGRRLAGDSALHSFIIRNVHSQVLAALDKRVPVEALEALGTIETKDAIAAVHAADEAAKAAAVRIIEVRTTVPGGKGYFTLTGEPGAVRTAVAAGLQVVPKGQLVSHVVIPFAHAQLAGTLGK